MAIGGEQSLNCDVTTLWPWVSLCEGNYHCATITLFGLLKNKIFLFSFSITGNSICWDMSDGNRKEILIQTRGVCMESTVFELWVIKIKWRVIENTKSKQSLNIKKKKITCQFGLFLNAMKDALFSFYQHLYRVGHVRL